MRRLTARVLLHLEEIERRGLYLQNQCSSLFEFCQKELGYSENEAFTRISATRLSSEVPEVVQAVESGRVSLTNLAKEIESDLRQIREFWGNQNLNDTESELLRMMAKLVLSRIDPEKKAKKEARIKAEAAVSQTGVPQSAAPCAPKVLPSEALDLDETGIEVGPVPPELITPDSRYIPVKIRRQVWLRDQGKCAYEQDATGQLSRAPPADN